MDAATLATKALDEVRAVTEQSISQHLPAVLPPIQAAGRIALYGVGREGLVIKSLAMRLFHLGLDAHVVGDMTTPHLGVGDLLIVSAGPGHFATVESLMNVAKRDGAKTVCCTATNDGVCARLADYVLSVPAQTMASDTGSTTSVLPMGSLYEVALFFVFEILILQLQEKLGVQHSEMRSRHTNLE